MSKTLIIVESPTKAKTISKFLGKEYTIKASMGHVRDLPSKEIGVDVDNGFKPKYVTDTKKLKIIKELKELAQAAETIYLASDHDREGEAISWHLKEVLKKELKDKPVYRIIFNEITSKAIQEAITTPGSIDDNKVDAQQARRILDRIVGYKISPLLWKIISTGLSAGRVQSVALRLICEREREILSFIPEEYWSIEGEFNKEVLPSFKATLQKWLNAKADLKNKQETDEILEKMLAAQAVIKELTKSERKIEPYPPYITSTLQQDGNKIINFSGKKTMKVAQDLYEAGYISYMRTDSIRISTEANDSCRALIKDRYGANQLSTYVREYQNKNKAQDAHEAIRPTDSFNTPENLASKLNPDQLKLYTLIWQRFIATQMKPVRLNTVSLEIQKGDAIFKTSGSTIIDKGFSVCYGYSSISLGEIIDKDYAVEDLLNTLKIEGKQHFTKPPARFSEASLVKELESLGIGRPSTYASITSTILEREYVKIEEKKFLPTDLGFKVCDFLVKQFDALFNVKFTAEMEDELDQIEYGKFNWKELLQKYYDVIKDLLGKVDIKASKQELVQETEFVCEKCNSKMVIKFGKKGEFLACSGFPKCKNIKNFVRKNGEITIVNNEPVFTDEKCPECGNPLVLRKGRFGEFTACSNYPKCKYIKKDPLLKCPSCKTGDIVKKKSVKGSFHACTNYPECKFISNGKPVEVVCPNCKATIVEELKKKSEVTHKCYACNQEFSTEE